MSSTSKIYNYIYVTGYTGKLVLLLMTADLIFHHEHKTACMNYQISQSKSTIDLSGLLLLAAFPKHSGDQYM